jgi:hypothetical protein
MLITKVAGSTLVTQAVPSPLPVKTPLGCTASRMRTRSMVPLPLGASSGSSIPSSLGAASRLRPSSTQVGNGPLAASHQDDRERGSPVCLNVPFRLVDDALRAVDRI